MAVIALAGGGTGGHVYPALAIGDELKRRGHQVLYYGDAGRLEGRVAEERGYTFRPVHAMQYPRGGLVGKVRFGLGLLRSIVATRGALRSDRVDLVFGVGGYISAPPVLAAWTLGLHRLIHEANVVPGMANKLCARVAEHVLMTYERTRDRIPGSAPRTVVGVPVNPAVIGGDRAGALARYGLSDEPVVLFVGGSLGAARINELAVAVALQPGRSVQVLHLCGPRYHEEVSQQLGDPLPSGVALVAYEDRMADAYAVASLAVCRAGSSTLAELTAVGLASLLVPSPNVTENHQEQNARGLEDAGAARVLVEADWKLDDAVGAVAELAADPDELEQMAQAARSQARLDAARLAADTIDALLQR